MINRTIHALVLLASFATMWTGNTFAYERGPDSNACTKLTNLAQKAGMSLRIVEIEHGVIQFWSSKDLPILEKVFATSGEMDHSRPAGSSKNSASIEHHLAGVGCQQRSLDALGNQKTQFTRLKFDGGVAIVWLSPDRATGRRLLETAMHLKSANIRSQEMESAPIL